MVETLNLPNDIIEFFDQYLAPESRIRRKLVTQVFPQISSFSTFTS
jgi:hypothetical protein